MANFNDYLEATRGAVEEQSAEMGDFFKGAQSSPKIPKGAQFNTYEQVLKLLGPDLLKAYIEETQGPGSAESYIAAMEKLRNKYGGGA